ncbi:MAG: ribonuclease Z [Spirochaetaceae bacterium]|nr:ribonuclease Z [Spirochaetaceae bacterium]
MNVELFVLGCSGMMPLPGRYLTSVLLRRDGELFLFDCGEATQISLKKLNLKWKKISVILISHMHADHVTGLPGMLMLSSQVERDDPLYIIGPPKLSEYIEANRRILDMYINYKIEVIEVPQGQAGTVFKGDGYYINAFPLNHTKPCLGYSFIEEERPGIFYPEKALELNIPKGNLWSKLQKGDSVELEGGRVITSNMVTGEKRSGRKFSFVTDTTFSPNIMPNVKDSDIFICEGMFTEELVESAAEKKHLTAKQAAEIALNAGGIGNLGLIHYSPRYNDKELVKLLEEAKAVFPNTFLTRDRQIINMKNKD